MGGVHEKDGPNTELKELLNQLIVCQKDIDKINQDTSIEMLNVEEKYEKLRKPLYKKRNRAIKRLPNFWGTSFSNNPQLDEFMGKEGLRSIRKLEVEYLENIKLGYRIHIHFYENPYFENKVLTKEIRFGNPKNGNCTTSTSTPIKWKKGKGDISKPSNNTETTYKNFFDWFSDNSNPNYDHIGDLIRDDIWINPLRYYCLESKPEDNKNEQKQELHDEQEEDNGDDECDEEENENLKEESDESCNEEYDGDDECDEEESEENSNEEDEDKSNEEEDDGDDECDKEESDENSNEEDEDI